MRKTLFFYIPAKPGTINGRLKAFCGAAAYSAAAFISTLAYSPFKEESFFKYPQDGRIKYGYAGSSPLLMQKDTDIAYTGTVYMYKKLLKIDFRKPEAAGLSYYIDGRYTGSSAKPGAMTQNLVKLDNDFGKRNNIRNKFLRIFTRTRLDANHGTFGF